MASILHSASFEKLPWPSPNFLSLPPPPLSRWDTATLAFRPGHRLALPVQKGLLLPSGPAGTCVSFLCKAISGLEDGRTSSSAVSGVGIGPCRLGKLAVTGKTTEGEGISDCDRGSGGGGIFPAVASVSQHVPAKTPPMPQTEGRSVGRSTSPQKGSPVNGLARRNLQQPSLESL